MSNTSTITFDEFAFNVGTLARKTRDASLPLHKAYHKGTPAQQADLQRRWLINYLMGNLQVDAKRAETIVSQGTGKGSTHYAEVKAARRSFNYHIVRETNVSQPTQAPAKHNRVSAKHKALAMAFLGEFEGETLDEQIKAAIALLKALK